MILLYLPIKKKWLDLADGLLGLFFLQVKEVGPV